MSEQLSFYYYLHYSRAQESVVAKDSKSASLAT